VAVRLHRADFVQGLVDIGADVGDPVLVARESFRTRRPNRRIGAITSGTPSTTSAVSLGLVITSITNAPSMIRVFSARTKPRADHHFQQRGVVGEARDGFAGAHGLEKSGRLFQQMPEHGAADVGRYALADTTTRSRSACRSLERARRRWRAAQTARVERGRVVSREAGVDDALEALAQNEHAARRNHQRDAGDGHARPVRPEEAQHPASCRMSRWADARGCCL